SACSGDRFPRRLSRRGVAPARPRLEPLEPPPRVRILRERQLQRRREIDRAARGDVGERIVAGEKLVLGELLLDDIEEARQLLLGVRDARLVARQVAPRLDEALDDERGEVRIEVSLPPIIGVSSMPLHGTPQWSCRLY